MTALGTVLLLFAACLGAGAAVLACVRVLGDFDRGEAVAWSFAAGFGVIGWLVFFAAALGHIGWGEMLALCLVAAAGMILLPSVRLRACAPKGVEGQAGLTRGRRPED